MMLSVAATLTAAAPEGPKAGAAPVAPSASPLNPELPPSLNKALEAVVSHSVLGALLVIALFVNLLQGYLMWSRKDVMDAALKARDKAHADAIAERDRNAEKDRTEWASELSQLQESRLALLERVMTVAGNATAVIQMHAASTNERTASADKLTEILREYISQSTIGRATLLKIAEELERQGRANAEHIQRLQQRGGPSL